MKKNLIALSLSSFIVTSAFATIDSYVTVKYPVKGLNESEFCLIDTIAVDGVSSYESSYFITSTLLNGPIMIPGLQAGENSSGLVQANVLRSILDEKGEGLKVSITPDEQILGRALIHIDVSAAAKMATTSDKKAELVSVVKMAIYSSMLNAFNLSSTKAKLVLNGMPNQDGIKNPIPKIFKNDFYKKRSATDYLSSLKKELRIADSIKDCQ